MNPSDWAPVAVLIEQTGMDIRIWKDGYLYLRIDRYWRIKVDYDGRNLIIDYKDHMVHEMHTEIDMEKITKITIGDKINISLATKPKLQSFIN